MFHITEINKGHSALSVLVSELDAFQSRLYPAESNHCLDFSTVDNDRLRCVIAHDAAGFPASCGAVLLQGGGFGEIKRLYIRPAYRGRRLGEQLIARLERLAATDLCHQLRLETGIHQQPAIALYRRCGYARCEAFPHYTDDPLSVFMSKSL
ncbi:MAG: GNAT family N-acetyltransferase [Sodalis sp. (in: enterobacteria)]|uniref:GNAT family N-acetyltransferase n=1 Tax=Sodalis sp. (in: enterobacteria) TaxID=1898979 RepID=UPI0039E322CA